MLPPRTILVAVDFSEPSRIALTLAARFAQQCDAALHVVHAEDPLLFAAAAESQVDLTAETREALSQFIATAPPAGELSARAHTVSGSPALVILDIAHQEGADLIVVGAHGISGAGRLLFGSVAEGLLRRADRSILLVPDGWTPPQPAVPGLAGVGPIVVGVDFSEASMAAVAAAVALADRLRTSVEAIHVVPDLPVPARWQRHAERAIAQRVDLARRELSRLLGALSASVPVTARVEQGNVAECLAEASVNIGSRHPLLLLGRRSSRSRDGAPGATAYRVASLGRVPVLMHEPQA
jgi:nucleotide-binding universal stress UspA family protein